MSFPVAEAGYANHRYWWADLAEESTPELQWPRSLEVYDQMRRQEAKVISVVDAIIRPVLGTNWWIDPAGAKSRVTKLVSEDLGLAIAGKKPQPLARTRDRFSWREHLRLALLMLVHGHSVFEQNYRIVNGQARLRKLAWRPPRSFSGIDVAADGGLVAVKQYPKPGDTDPVVLPVNRLVFYCHEREGGAWLGRSILRPAYKYWLLKDRALRTQAQMIERSGGGVPWYTASEQPDDLDAETLKQREKAELDAGESAAKRLRSGSNAGGAGPYGSKMELLTVGRLPDSLGWIRYCDQMMAEAALENFLTLGGDDSTGSYALGQTFSDFFVLSLQHVAQFIADMATQHIVEDLVDANFGPSEPAPRVVCDEIGSKHPITAQALQLLAQAQLITWDEPTERWIRNIHGMPEADPATRRAPDGATPTPTPTSDPEPEPDQDPKEGE